MKKVEEEKLNEGAEPDAYDVLKVCEQIGMTMTNKYESKIGGYKGEQLPRYLQNLQSQMDAKAGKRGREKG